MPGHEAGAASPATGASRIHGTGVFARGRIGAGDVVLVCGGELVERGRVDPSARAMQVDDDLCLMESADAPCLSDFLNHSCDANLGFKEGTLTLQALRSVGPGEELTLDYSTTINEPGWVVPCLCGAASCRGAIRSFCDLEPALRQRLGRNALDYLRRGLGADALSPPPESEVRGAPT